MEFVLPPHTYLESWQTTRFRENVLGTIGDALSGRSTNHWTVEVLVLTSGV